MNSQHKIIVLAMLCTAGLSLLVSAAENPVVTGTYPVQNALNIAADAVISATFDIDINPATVNSSTFTVNSRIGGRVAGAIAYDNTTKTVTFTPADNFCTGDQVVVQLSTRIQAPDGSALSQSYNWSFTVNVADGTESVKPRAEYTTSSSPYWPIAADLNGNGVPDAACVNSTGPNTSEFVIYLNRSDGTFDVMVSYPSATDESAAIAADVDGDGDIDLVSVQRLTGNLSVMPNNGDGTFSDPGVFLIGSQPLSICGADFDGDGDYDMAVTYSYTGRVGMMTNGGGGEFTLNGSFETGGFAFDVLSGDVNNDGFVDIVTANDGLSSGSITVLLNQGDGTFGSPNEYYLNGSFDFMYGDVLALADFDADGDIDIAAAVSDNEYVAVLFNNGDGSFMPEAEIGIPGNPTSIIVADMLADGNMDILVSLVQGPGFSLLSGNGDGAFAPVAFPPDMVSNARFSFTAADFDGDGRLDLLLPDYQKNNIRVMVNGYVCGDANFDGIVNVGDIVYLIGHIFKGGAAPYPFESADANGDGIVNIGDAVYFVNFIFKQGDAPICGQ